jgi:hypothetical protein
MAYKLQDLMYHRHRERPSLKLRGVRKGTPASVVQRTKLVIDQGLTLYLDSTPICIYTYKTTPPFAR